MSLKTLAEETLSALGPVKLSEYGPDLSKRHAAPALLKHYAFESGDQAHEYRRIASKYAIHSKRLPHSPKQIVAFIKQLRAQAVKDWIDAFECAFYRYCGKLRNPKGWRPVIIRHLWMQESVSGRSNEEAAVVTLSAVVRFERKRDY